MFYTRCDAINMRINYYTSDAWLLSFLMRFMNFKRNNLCTIERERVGTYQLRSEIT